MTKILCVGSVCKDIFFPTEEGKIIATPEDLTSQKKIAFELGAKYKIDERYESLGGCAANVGVGLSKLGMEAQVAATVGEDEIGKWILAELQKNKVKTETILFQKTKSDLSAIIVDTLSADRVIFSNKNSGGEINLDAEKVKETGWIFLGDVHENWEEQMDKIIQIAQTGKKKIAFNPREVHIQENVEKIVKIISLCDAVFLNKDEAIEIISKTRDDYSSEELNKEKFLLKNILELGPKLAVLTDGKRGAWASSGEKIFFAKGQEVKALDSTGAGDAFLSGFLAAYAQEKDMSECLKWGIANSAGAVQKFGATPGLLSEEKIIEEIGKIEVSEI